jgi:hypothetical protein
MHERSPHPLPWDNSSPNPQEFARTLAWAEELYRFIFDLLPPEMRPIISNSHFGKLAVRPEFVEG